MTSWGPLIRHLHCFEMKAHQFHGLHCPPDDLWAPLSLEIAPENGCSVKTGGIGEGRRGRGDRSVALEIRFVACARSQEEHEQGYLKVSCFWEETRFVTVILFLSENVKALHEHDIQGNQGRKKRGGNRKSGGGVVINNLVTKSACKALHFFLLVAAEREQVRLPSSWQQKFSFPGLTNSLKSYLSARNSPFVITWIWGMQTADPFEIIITKPDNSGVIFKKMPPPTWRPNKQIADKKRLLMSSPQQLNPRTIYWFSQEFALLFFLKVVQESCVWRKKHPCFHKTGCLSTIHGQMLKLSAECRSEGASSPRRSPHLRRRISIRSAKPCMTARSHSAAPR